MPYDMVFSDETLIFDHSRHYGTGTKILRHELFRQNGNAQSGRYGLYQSLAAGTFPEGLRLDLVNSKDVI